MKRNKKRDYLSILLLLVVGLSIGYALLQTTLTINGTSKIKGNTWDIHFANLSVTEGSVTIGTGDVAAAIQSSTTDITYTVTLNEPGDFYEFTVDAVNAGSIDGMIESVTSKLNNVPITTLPAYLDYSVAYSDGIEIAPNQYLKCRPVASKQEAIACQIDLDGSLWVFTNVGNGEIYTKQINNDGTASFHTYVFTQQQNPYASGQYVTKDQFNKVIQALTAAITPMQEKLNANESNNNNNNKQNKSNVNTPTMF